MAGTFFLDVVGTRELVHLRALCVSYMHYFFHWHSTTRKIFTAQWTWGPSTFSSNCRTKTDENHIEISVQRETSSHPYYQIFCGCIPWSIPFLTHVQPHSYNTSSTPGCIRFQTYVQKRNFPKFVILTFQKNTSDSRRIPPPQQYFWFFQLLCQKQFGRW